MRRALVIAAAALFVVASGGAIADAAGTRSHARWSGTTR